MPHQDSPVRRRAPSRNRPSPPPGRAPAGMTMRQGLYRLPDDVARRVQLGHPWVYREAFGSRKVTEPTGSLVELLGGNRVFLGRGYVDADHPVAVRVMTREADRRVHPGAGAVATRFARAV
jgi:23S rRNA G2069 N7-methylase RlmK/C1962 C5-methylase RlmI